MLLDKAEEINRPDIYQVALGFIFLLAVFLRFHELGQPYFWVSEIHGVWPAKHFLEGMGFSGPAGPSYPVTRAWLTYEVPIAASFAVFGATEFAARLPSVLIGLATVLLSYSLGKDVRGKKLGLLFSAMMAVDFWVVSWHTQARMYVHAQFLYLLGVWLLHRWYSIDDMKMKSSYLLALIPVGALGLHNHRTYLGLGPVFGVFLGASLIQQLRKQGWNLESLDDSLTRRHLIWLTATVSAGALYILVEGVPKELINYAPDWYVWNRGSLWYLNWLSENTSVLYFFGMGFVLSLRKRKNWLIPLAFIVPFTVQSLILFKEERFIFHLYPLYLLMASLAIVYLVDALRSLLKPVLVEGREDFFTVACIFVLLFTLFSPLADLQSKDEKPHGIVVGANHREPVKYIERRMDEDDIILSSAPSLTGWYFGSMDEVDYDINVLRDRNVSGRLIDPRTGVRAVRNRTEMRRIMKENSGWVIADSNFYRDFKIRGGVRKAIVQSSRKIENKSWEQVDIYRFKEAK